MEQTRRSGASVTQFPIPRRIRCGCLLRKRLIPDRGCNRGRSRQFRDRPGPEMRRSPAAWPQRSTVPRSAAADSARHGGALNEVLAFGEEQGHATGQALGEITDSIQEDHGHSLFKIMEFGCETYGQQLCRICCRSGPWPERCYAAPAWRKRSVARTMASAMPGSVTVWPASGMISSSASGQARCKAQADSMGVTTS